VAVKLRLEGGPLFEQAKIAVIVPCYNESRLVGRMLRRLPEWIDIIVAVDDASSDSTADAITAVGDPRIRFVKHEINQGVGAAIRTGYLAALEQQADILVVMAGDDQMDPADLPALLAPIVSFTAEYVKGNRFIHRDVGAMPIMRRLGGALLSYVTRIASGLRVDDSQCGYTALASLAVNHLPLADLWPRFGYPNDLLLLLAARGQRVVEVPVRPVYADEKSGLRPWHILQILGVILRRFGREPNLRASRLLLRAPMKTLHAQRSLSPMAARRDSA